MAWSDRLIRPIDAPGGKRLVTLEDAAVYFQSLPKARRDDPLIKDSMFIVIDVAEGRAPDLLAQSAVANIVHGPAKPQAREKRERPWMERRKA